LPINNNKQKLNKKTMDAPQNFTCSTISALTSSHKSSQIVVAHIRKRLPYGYTIGDNDVYCGRGVLCSTHVGNHRFRLIVLANLERYCTAQTKSKKTAIIYEVVDHVRSLSPDGVGGFVTKESSMQGFWFEVGDLVAVSKQYTTISLNYSPRKINLTLLSNK
jgi:hypothetical protein